MNREVDTANKLMICCARENLQINRFKNDVRTALRAHVGREVLGSEEIEDQLAHPLFVVGMKLEEFHPDRVRLHRANHG